MLCLPWKEPTCWTPRGSNIGEQCNSSWFWIAVAALGVIIVTKGKNDRKEGTRP